MNGENLYNRMQENLANLRKARQRTVRLVDQFISVAIRLRKWKTVGFEGAVSSGETIKDKMATSIIRLDDAPSLETIYRARQRWRQARNDLRATLQAMSHEEREETLRRYPKMRKLLG